MRNLLLSDGFHFGRHVNACVKKRKRLTHSNAIALHFCCLASAPGSMRARCNDNRDFSSTQAWSQTTHACGCRVLLGHGSLPAQEKKHLRQAVTPLLPSDRTSLGWASKDATFSHSLAPRTTPNRPCRIALTRSTTKENDEYTHTHCSLRSGGCRSCGFRPKDRKRCHVICLTRFHPPKHSLSSRPGAAVRILRLKNRASTN